MGLGEGGRKRSTAKYHLVGLPSHKNLAEALEAFFLHKKQLLKEALPRSRPPPPDQPPPAPWLRGQTRQAEAASLSRHSPWVERYHQIHTWYAQHVDRDTIAERLGVSRHTVSRYLRMDQPPERKQARDQRSRPLDRFKPYLLQRWNEGCRNAKQLWRELQGQGYTQSRSTVQRFIGLLRHETGQPHKFKQAQAAAQLKGLIRHRYELIQESTQRKNKLTALCDELFPEFTRICHNPNAPSALALRAKFPTPQAVATASLAALQQARKGNLPSNAKLLELQRLATESIGTKDLIRQRGLVIEQHQLVQELLLIQTHVEQLEDEIGTIIAQAREGQILMSMGMGVVQAATIIATIGSIHNFPSAAALKSYFGWAPKVTQSGKTIDRSSLTPGGNRVMKQMMFWIVASAIKQESEWAKLYARLVQATCPYDERTGTRTGRKRVMGRIAGQMIEVMYALLKQDAEVLSKTPPGKVLPAPTLYDPVLHRQHREGHYRSSKSAPPPKTIYFLPPS